MSLILRLTKEYLFVFENFKLLHSLKKWRWPYICQLFTYNSPIWTLFGPNQWSWTFWMTNHNRGNQLLSLETHFICLFQNCVGAKPSRICGPFEFCHNLTFVTIWLLSQFGFCHNLSFVTTWVFPQLEFCHNSSLSPEFWVLSQFDFFFKVLSQFDFWSFVTIWVFEFHPNLSFEFCHNLSFWVSSQFELLTFIPIWVLEFHHNLSHYY